MFDTWYPPAATSTVVALDFRLELHDHNVVDYNHDDDDVDNEEPSWPTIRRILQPAMIALSMT